MLDVPGLNYRVHLYEEAYNKFEKSNYKEICPEFLELYTDLSSERFNNILTFITAKKTFVDPKNFGGGLHQGKKNSFLDMHLDFNYHPLNKSLLYLQYKL